jgi:hypothetical protein
MGILDEAIREHLELKRQHGADESELKQLEDDAFGPPRRPDGGEEMSDTAAEAATEFMAQPDAGGLAEPEDEDEAAPERQERPPRREPIADVQEPPERPAPEGEEEHLDDLADEGPAEEEQPAAEHEAITMQPELEGGLATGSHSTEEREIIADQPTQMFDVEQEFEDGPESAGPSDEEEEDFFDEQRLSDELDQALDAPLEPESEEISRPVSEEYDEEPEDEDEEPEEYDEEPEDEEYERPAARGEEDEDVLEETPDFLEEGAEDDQLWFEQKPPKDFDFDD